MSRRQQLEADLARHHADRQLLQHPFYQRWQAGELEPSELATYAEQYRYFETSLPGFLRRLISKLGEGRAADLMRVNLSDEESTPKAHVDLFEDFAVAAGARSQVAPTAATSHLLNAYEALIAATPAEGLSAVVAYESQAPSIAASKALGLRERYGFDKTGTQFWDVHGTMDLDHAAWSVEALASLDAPAELVNASARRSLDAWWAFLDEREAARN